MGVQQEIIKRTPAFLGTAKVTDSTGAETDQALGGATGALAIGVPGNIYDASPARIHTESLTTAADIGTFVPGKGIIVNPREYALRGEAGKPLAPSLTLPAGTPASFMTFGHVVVKKTEVANIIAASGKMAGSIIFDPPSAQGVTAASYDAATTVQNSHPYAVGDVGTEGSSPTKYYVCIAAYTSDASATAFSSDTTHWAELDTDTLGVCVIEVNGLN